MEQPRDSVLQSVKNGLKHGLLIVLAVGVAALVLTAFHTLQPPGPNEAVPRRQPRERAEMPAEQEGAGRTPRRGSLHKGTAWVAPPDGDRLGYRLEFRPDGTLIGKASNGEVETGAWDTTEAGFGGWVFYKDQTRRRWRTLRGACSEDRLELQVKTEIEFTADPTPAPESDWANWSWGWKKEAAR